MGETPLVDMERLVDACSFDDSGRCAVSCLEVRPEVREMCASGRCRQYGRNWACPPACGTLEEYRQRISAYADCCVVQTVGTLEDEFDIEGMMHFEQVHKERVMQLADALHAQGADALVLAAGTCTLCPECSCPDAPCRFPKRRLVSMEAAGLLVSDVCTQAGVAYNHGKGTVAYTSCVLM